MIHVLSHLYYHIFLNTSIKTANVKITLYNISILIYV